MITFDSEMEKLPPERRARIEARTQELLKQNNMIRLQAIEALLNLGIIYDRGNLGNLG